MSLWGPRRIAADRTEFRLWAPDRTGIWLETADGTRAAMNRREDGWFSVTADIGSGGRYRFRLDDDLVAPDPASRAQSGGVHGWSVVLDEARQYPWRATGWRGRPWEEAIILEVHAGASGGFRGLMERLPAIADLGITAVELMPIGAFGGERNWGYDGVLLFAPAESYGTPDELKALIDRAHSLGLMMLLDVVYNHFGPDGNYIGAFASGFFDPDIHTPWGGAVAVEKPAVQAFFLENALLWLRDYRFDGLRLDAVHAIANSDFLDRLAQDLRSAVPDRAIHLILENETNDADRLAPGLYDAQWNDDFHNVLHVLLTGETEAYYADFADRPAELLARCLAEGFIYQGQGSPNHGGATRGTPSGHLAPSSFVTFLQNHDQVGNRALGDRLTILADPQALQAATALLLLSPQIPLLFMGDPDGSQTPFLFFTDFHDELADAVREGRRREFGKFAAFADAEARAAIPDPNARETFDRSIPAPGPDAPAWQALYRELIALRHEHIVPRLSAARALGADVIGKAAVHARWQMADGATLSIAINLGDEDVEFPAASGRTLFARGEPDAPSSVRVELGA